MCNCVCWRVYSMVSSCVHLFVCEFIDAFVNLCIHVFEHLISYVQFCISDFVYVWELAQVLRICKFVHHNSSTSLLLLCFSSFACLNDRSLVRLWVLSYICTLVKVSVCVFVHLSVCVLLDLLLWATYFFRGFGFLPLSYDTCGFSCDFCTNGNPCVSHAVFCHKTMDIQVYSSSKVEVTLLVALSKIFWTQVL